MVLEGRVGDEGEAGVEVEGESLAAAILGTGGIDGPPARFRAGSRGGRLSLSPSPGLYICKVGPFLSEHSCGEKDEVGPKRERFWAE